MNKQYPCGKCVLSCSVKDSRECLDGRYAVEHWGGICSWYNYDESTERNNLGKNEKDFTYEE